MTSVLTDEEAQAVGRMLIAELRTVLGITLHAPARLILHTGAELPVTVWIKARNGEVTLPKIELREEKPADAALAPDKRREKGLDSIP